MAISGPYVGNVPAKGKQPAPFVTVKASVSATVVEEQAWTTPGTMENAGVAMVRERLAVFVAETAPDTRHVRIVTVKAD